MYDKGMELRVAVMGKAYVDRALAANQDDIGKPIQDFITEHGWGAVWGREGLDRKTRSILNLAMLSILNRQHELRGHVRGAITNGVTKDEIREIFLHIGLYAGAPVMLELGADREGSDRRDGEGVNRPHAPFTLPWRGRVDANVVSVGVG